MLALMEVPEYLQQMYEQYKKLSQAIYNAIKEAGEDRKIAQGTNLLQLTDELSFVYIVDGFFKLFINGKPVRLYSDSDFIISGGKSEKDATLEGEFGGKVVVFTRETLFKIISRHQKMMDALFRLTDLENKINRTLAATLMRQDAAPDFLMKEYEDGDIIINEGEKSTDIFEMLSGEAEALQGDTVVGKINEGEIFGEVSFFTGEARNATVRATESCMVRIINQSNFAEMIKNNPNFAIAISRTLAKRSSDVNRRLSESTTIELIQE